VIVTGAAGLVGQNLVLMLKERGYADIVAIDQHARNLEVLRGLVPEAKTVVADMAQPGPWEELFDPGTLVFVLHAHITGKHPGAVRARQHRGHAAHAGGDPRRGAKYLVHVSSSVVISVADDDYTAPSGARRRWCGLGPAALRAAAHAHVRLVRSQAPRLALALHGADPVVPDPGDGRFMRQPLYIRDFCRALVWAGENTPAAGLRRGRRHAHRLRGHHPAHQEGEGPADLDRAHSRWASSRRCCALRALQPQAAVHRRPARALAAGDDFKGVDTEARSASARRPSRTRCARATAIPRYSHVLVT
jgi:uncharacterized protein YbjT (DUF2867 family)